MPTASEIQRVLKALRRFGLAYPRAHLKSPWPGHKDLAVADKTFCYLSVEGAPLAISCKLPHSGDAALLLPFTKPTAYGLGKSGWVSADFESHALPPIELFEQWIDESYRAQAPKRAVAELDRLAEERGAPPRSNPARSERVSTRKTTAKKAAPKKLAKKKAAAKKAAPKKLVKKKAAAKKAAPNKPAKKKAAPKKARAR